MEPFKPRAGKTTPDIPDGFLSPSDSVEQYYGGDAQGFTQLRDNLRQAKLPSGLVPIGGGQIVKIAPIEWEDTRAIDCLKAGYIRFLDSSAHPLAKPWAARIAIRNPELFEQERGEFIEETLLRPRMELKYLINIARGALDIGDWPLPPPWDQRFRTLKDYIEVGELRAFTQNNIVDPTALVARQDISKLSATHTELDWLRAFCDQWAEVQGAAGSINAMGEGAENVSLNSAKTACKVWLGENSAPPNQKDKTKNGYRTEAIEKFGGLSVRGFNSAWDESADPSWSKPGRTGKKS